MNPALIERLAAISSHVATLGHGARSDYLAEQAAALGMSVQTLYRKLGAVMVKPTRKRRSDACKTALSLQDAKVISALLLETYRKNGKDLMTVEHALEILRSNGEIDATRINRATGEVIPLSASTISRALRGYRLHPEQLLQPAPVNRMKSTHPNQCWQIDPSLCVLYYLPRSQSGGGLKVLGEAEFYKNKPQNAERIEKDRVWRYTGTDHYSGTICVRYYYGGETSANLCDFFIFMMQEKRQVATDPFRGVPDMVMLDPGSANTSTAFKNLCRALGVQVQINKPGNPRSKGQVEKANDMVETKFESRLKLVNIENIDNLNRRAEAWMSSFNGDKKHGRHKLTRYQAWNRIEPEQLILPPPADYCRELAISAPKEAKVSPDLEIRFGGRHFSVSDIAGVYSGQKVWVAKNPWQPNGARVASSDSNGNEIWQEVPEVAFDDIGFRSDAAIIGAEYKGRPETVTQQHAKELEKLLMDTDTLQDAAAKRKGKTLPFGGRIDPFKHQDEELAARNTLYLPKTGTPLEYNRMEVLETVLNKVELAILLKPRVEAAGGNWQQAVKVLQQLYPNGAAEREVEAVFAHLLATGSLKLHKTGTAS